MSDHLDQLRDTLDEALRTINPGPAPVHAAVRRGKGIRARRRLTAFAGIAAVVAAGVVGYPALTHNQPAPRPPVTSRHTPSVTDVPPGPHAAKGEIATGTIYGKPWQLVTGKPGTRGMPPALSPGQQQCFVASGSAGISQAEPLMQCLPNLAPDAAAPVDFTELGAGAGTELSIGRVLAGVRYVTVDLSDGTRLTLIPASVDGARYVAFAMPGTLTVESANAYLGNGQIRTAIPFSLPPNVVGKQKFFAFLGNGKNPREWTAYNAAGNAVSSSGPVKHS